MSNKLKKLVKSRRVILYKLIDRISNGQKIPEKLITLWIGDLSDEIRILNMIDRNQLSKAYNTILDLDSDPREEFPDNIWRELLKEMGLVDYE